MTPPPGRPGRQPSRLAETIVHMTRAAPGILARLIVELLSPETLPADEVGRAAHGRGVGLLRWLFSPEKLDESSPRAGEDVPAERQSVIRLLLASESLGEEEPGPEATSRRPGFLRWLLWPESLPHEGGESRERGGNP